MISIRSYFVFIILVIGNVLADVVFPLMGKFFGVHKHQVGKRNWEQVVICVCFRVVEFFFFLIVFKNIHI